MKRIGKYEVLGLLGKGGMGKVYKCRLPVAGKIVALKLLAPEEILEMLLGMDELTRRFKAEAAMLGSVDHPFVASVLDFDYDSRGRPFYVMEYYCENLGVILGETYETDKPCRLLPPEKAVRYAGQTIEGLGRLHHAGIVHRDIKPFNLLITRDDRIKIIDFGLSSLRGEVDANPDNLKIGTPFYTSPEQESDPQSADARSDLFSVGVILWRMLTGYVPEAFHASRRPSSLNPVLHGDFDQFLKKAAHPEVDKRFQSAGEMFTGLKDAYEDWCESVAAACAIEEESPEPKSKGNPPAPRSEPAKVAVSGARRFFGLDELWRPPDRPHAFEERGDGTVFDPATGLTWERAGSAYAVTWQGAKEHVEELSREKFAGADDWRLPTVDELAGLIRPVRSLDDICVEPVFDRAQSRLWSADKKSFTAAWYADATLGFIAFQDFTCRFHARAVRGPENSGKRS